jgi:RNA polymerase sigma-70 factor (ECF subfamily)
LSVKQNIPVNSRIQAFAPCVKQPLPEPRVLLRCRGFRDFRAPSHRHRRRYIKKGNQLATYKELADFLAGVERRAFKQAVFSVRDDHLALDIVQDAMFKLSEKYSDHPVTEFPMLFQRILQNAIRDFFRRQKVRSAWVTPLSTLFGSGAEEDYDPLETMEVDNTSKVANRPAEQLEQKQVLDFIEKAVATLPLRQRQAFMLRYWEELDVAEAAKAMGCSEGSVKTHCSRATHALAILLKKQGIEL